MTFKSCLQSLTIFFFIIMISGFVADKAGLFGETTEDVLMARKNPAHLKVNTNYPNRIKLKGQEEVMFSSSKSSAIFHSSGPIDVFYSNTTMANTIN